ncbi:MAG: alpha/beta hydrolase [bacterium]|nr:alpha/beta hydrolase [bacterium]
MHDTGERSVTGLATSRTVKGADNLHLHVHRRPGAGPALLLAHGITGSGQMWADLVPDLPDDWDVVAPDVRGHGRSGRAPVYDYQLLAQDVALVCRQFCLQRPGVVGHSMGAATVAACAALAQDLFCCIVLEDPPWRQAERSAAARRKRATVWRQQLEVQEQGTIEARMADLQQVRSAWTAVARRSCAEAERATDPGVLELVASGAPDWRSTLAAITCPVLLVCGDPARGAIVTPEIAAEADTINGRLEVVTFSGAGHSVRADVGADYTHAVIGFLRRHLAAQSTTAS